MPRSLVVTGNPWCAGRTPAFRYSRTDSRSGKCQVAGRLSLLGCPGGGPPTVLRGVPNWTVSERPSPVAAHPFGLCLRIGSLASASPRRADRALTGQVDAACGELAAVSLGEPDEFGGSARAWGATTRTR